MKVLGTTRGRGSDLQNGWNFAEHGISVVQQDRQQRLAANTFRGATLVEHAPLM